MKTKITVLAAILSCAAYSLAADAVVSEAANVPEREINTLADEDFAAKALERFSASATFGYESEYVFRGTHICGASLTPEVDLGYDIGSGFAAYAGVWSNMALDDSSYKEVDVYTGITYTYDFLTLDLGYLAYLYPDADEFTENTNELKIAASVDTTQWLGEFNVSPFAAFYYDFNLKASTVEAGLSYSAPVTKWFFDRNWGTVELGATYGHVSSDDGAYNYVGLSADAVVAVNQYFSISAGIRYAWRDNMEQVTYLGRDRLWFGTSASITF